MIRLLFSKYKYALLLSFVLCVVIVAIRLESRWYNFIFIILGALFGTFLLDSDYIFFTYFIDPKHYFSVNIQHLVKQRNFSGALQYINYHKGELRGLPLHSTLFQVLLAIVSLYIMLATKSVFGKTLTLVMMGQIFFEQAQDYMEKKDIGNWFWVLKVKPAKEALIFYFALLGVFFLYLLSLA